MLVNQITKIDCMGTIIAQLNQLKIQLQQRARFYKKYYLFSLVGKLDLHNYKTRPTMDVKSWAYGRTRSSLF